MVGGTTTQQGFPVKNAVGGSLAGACRRLRDADGPGSRAARHRHAARHRPVARRNVDHRDRQRLHGRGRSVTLGGSRRRRRSASTSNEITAVTGPHAAGPVAVRVDNPDGSAGELANGFTYTCGSAVPTAAVSGSTTICSGDTASLSAALIGKRPLDPRLVRRLRPERRRLEPRHAERQPRRDDDVRRDDRRRPELRRRGERGRDDHGRPAAVRGDHRSGRRLHGSGRPRRLGPGRGGRRRRTPGRSRTARSRRGPGRPPSPSRRARPRRSSSP